MLSWSLNDVVLRLKFLSLSYLFSISLDFPSLSSSFIISNSKMDIRKEYTIILNSITNCTICKFFISKIFFHMPRKITHPFDKEHAFFFFRSSAEAGLRRSPTTNSPTIASYAALIYTFFVPPRHLVPLMIPWISNFIYFLFQNSKWQSFDAF